MSNVVVIQDGQIAADLRYENDPSDALPYTRITFRTTSVHDALVFNLPGGSYYITETITPAGYAEADKIRFDVAPNATQVHVEGTPADQFTRRVLMLDMADPSGGQTTPSPEPKGSAVPATGEDATMTLTLATVCLVISAGVTVYAVRKNKESENE